MEMESSHGEGARNKIIQKLQNPTTPFVFHFDVGNVGAKNDEKFAVAESFALKGNKPITFRSGDCNDAMTVGSIRLGTREGGSILPAITFVDDDDRISRMKLGMSFYAGENVAANFCAAIEQLYFKNITTGEVKFVEGLSANLRTEDTPSWTYDRDKMGLDLWLTSAYYMKGVKGSKSMPIFRYGFALSASEDLTFSNEAFEEFWRWLVLIKYYHVNYQVVNQEGTTSTTLSRLKSTHYKFKTELSDIKDRMKGLHDFLIQTFSENNQLIPSMGFLRATRTHISLTHDCFHIYVKLIPDINYDEKIVSTLFVNGIQCDLQGKKFESLSADPLEIQSYSILSVLEDLEMLFEMGLLRSHDLVLSEEREILPLRNEGAFSGDYNMTTYAARAFHFLATAGLRKVAIEEVFTMNEGWDVYDIAAGYKGIFNVPNATAITCMFIQIGSPITLAIRAFYTGTDDELSYVVYITRCFFVIYAVFYELKLQGSYDDEARLASFLTMLPDFDSPWLIAGVIINLIAKLSLSIGIITLIWFSYTVIDVTLNSLALYFILEIDNNLVSSSVLDEFRDKQKDAIFHMKFVSSRYYHKKDFVEDQIWTFRNWPLLAVLMRLLNILSFTIISLGALLIIIIPFFVKYRFI